MTLTEVIEYVKMELGASHYPLEIDDNGLIDIVKKRTIPVFSSYFPYFIQ